MTRKSLRRVLLASSWGNQVFALALAQCARDLGWHLDLQTHLTGELPDRWEGEGIIAVLGGRISQFVKKAKCPVVSASLNDPKIAVPRIDFDCDALARLATEHLLEKRFTSFAWHSHAWHVTDRIRCECFATIVGQAGHPCARLIWEKEKGRRCDTWANRQRWLTRRIRELPKPLAVFAVDDTVAVEVIEACLQAGFSIPDDVAVLGIGNIEIFRERTVVPLSSVIVDFRRLAAEAASMLDRIMGGTVLPNEAVLLHPDGIAERRSTETIAVDHPQVAQAIRFMLENYARPIGVKDIVAATTTSQTRLYMAFQEELSESPVSLLGRIRIDKAKQMLRDTDHKVSAVAKACGFGNSVNLYRCFRRVAGTSPRDYRNSGASGL